MHIAAMKMLRPGMKEYEVASAIQAVAFAAGGDLSFPPLQRLTDRHSTIITMAIRFKAAICF